MHALQILLLLVFPALAIVAALKDVTSYTIPNWISLALVAAFLARIEGESVWMSADGLSNAERSDTDAAAHASCNHAPSRESARVEGEDYVCLVGYGALMTILEDPALFEQFATMAAT